MYAIRKETTIYGHKVLHRWGGFCYEILLHKLHLLDYNMLEFSNSLDAYIIPENYLEVFL